MYECNKGLSALLFAIDELHADTGFLVTGIEHMHMNDFSANMDRLAQAGHMKEGVNDIM